MPDAFIADTAVSLLGVDAVRLGTPSDAVEGVVPTIIVEPASPDAVGAVLEWASRQKLCVLVRGSGSKLGWGPAPRQVDVLMSTTRLNAVVAHRHGDLTATIQAGATLGDVNRALAQHRQWIPLDPPFADRATIGGLVATNDSGPRRHRYGSPRDLIIGVEFARADGRLAKGGGIVVKNVAGYDLPRLMTGSFGSLGVIVTATFKLYPLTAASRTLLAEPSSPSDLGALALKLAASHLTPTALEFTTHPLRLLVRFESIEASVDPAIRDRLEADRGERLPGASAFGIGGAGILGESRALHRGRSRCACEGECAADRACRNAWRDRAAGGQARLHGGRTGRGRRIPASDYRGRAVAEARHRRTSRCPSAWPRQRRSREGLTRAEGVRRCVGSDGRWPCADEGRKAPV